MQSRTMRCLILVLLVAVKTRGWVLPSVPLHASPAKGSESVLLRDGYCGAGKCSALFLSDTTPAEDEPHPKTKLATDLMRLFDINEMAYTVMVREESKGPDGKLTPDQLLAAIKKDSMFGEDFEEYCEKHATDGDVQILDIGKFADDMQSSAPLPDEDNLTIPGKGNYLVHLSFAEGILATMRIVVD